MLGSASQFVDGSSALINPQASAWLPTAPVYMVGSTPVPANGEPARLSPPPQPGSMLAAKKLVTISGEKVLIEEVNFSQLAPLFAKLGQAAVPHKLQEPFEGVAPSRRLARAASKSQTGTLQVARGPYIAEGITLDPTVTLTGSASSWLFRPERHSGQI